MMKRLLMSFFNVRDNPEMLRPKSFSQPGAELCQTVAKLTSTARKSSPGSTTETKTDAQADCLDVSALFYSLLFACYDQAHTGIANDLERRVLANVEDALSTPEIISETIMKLPHGLAELNQKLADQTLDTKELLGLIEQDPVLCAEILRLSNSPAFCHGTKEILCLQQAVVILGRDQLKRFVTSCLVREIIDIKPIYFRRFGAEIWRHSMQVAFLAAKLAERQPDQNPDAAFLLGLLHDVGKIAIFKMLLDAFVQSEVGEQPNSWLFRRMMTQKSLTLSALLAKCWQLPATITQELELLANIDATPQPGLVAQVWRANIISECSMLLQAEKLTASALKDLLAKVGLDEEEFMDLHARLMAF